MQAHQPRPTRRCLEHLGVEPRRHMHASPGLEFVAGLHHRLPRVVAALTEQEHFGARARVAVAEQSRAEDTRRVEHQRVAGAQVLR